MKNKIILICAILLILVTVVVATVDIVRDDSEIPENVYEPGFTEEATMNDSTPRPLVEPTVEERVYEEGELEEIQEGFSNIERDDERVAGNERYITTENNTSQFKLSEASVMTQNIVDYLIANGYTSGTIYSSINGPQLLDGYTEWYTDSLLFIREEYPDWSDEFYFEYISEDMTENFYMIELDGIVTRIDFSY